MLYVLRVSNKSSHSLLPRPHFRDTETRCSRIQILLLSVVAQVWHRARKRSTASSQRSRRDLSDKDTVDKSRRRSSAIPRSGFGYERMNLLKKLACQSSTHPVWHEP